MIQELVTYKFTCDKCKAVATEVRDRLLGQRIPEGWSWKDSHGHGSTGYTAEYLYCSSCIRPIDPTWAPHVGATVRRKGFGSRTKGVIVNLDGADKELPVGVRFEDGSESWFSAAALEPGEYECPRGHAQVERLQNEIDGARIHEALRCLSCKVNYVQLIGGRWFQAP